MKIRVVPDAHPSLIMQAFLMELRLSRFFWSSIKGPLATMPEMLQHANQYITAKALVVGKQENHKRPHTEKPQGRPPEPLRRRPN
ncbi:hypothetical protein BHM03_00032507 [Ensete ventricosum]|nr:hypothetical protein BHM03_00032507 [Ensete ventricosum]